jgi:uracil-DNA glycosylase
MPDGFSEKSSPARRFLEITEEAAAYLRFLAELGGTGFDLSGQSLSAVASWGQPAFKNSEPSGIFDHFIKCRKCALAGHRQHVVSGMGNPAARLMIIGGVPEAEDAQTGKPYSGRAGALLDNLLKAMALTREDVYLTFAVKCCLPEAAIPGINVVNSCRAYLRSELMRLRPEIIVVFGQVAAMSLLETSLPLSGLRGRFHDYKGIPLMPTHAPEYLIEHTDAKRETWEDIKQVMAMLKIKN